MKKEKYDNIFRRLPNRDETLNVWISSENKAFLLQICKDTHLKLGEAVEELLTALREGRMCVREKEE